MKLEQFVAVFIRLSVIYVVATIIFQNILILTALAAQLQLGKPFWFQVVFVLAVSAVLIALWKNAPRLAARMTPAPTDAHMQTPFTLDALQTTCFTILGVWISVDSLIGLVGYLIAGGAVFKALAYGLRLVLGVALLFGAPRLTRWLNKIRA